MADWIEVTPNNVHIKMSWTVSKHAFREILEEVANYNPDCLVFIHRPICELTKEWATHNALYDLGLFKSRTRDTDLNYPCNILARIAYLIVGTIVWPFIP